MFGLPGIQRHVPGLPDFEWFLLCFVICILAASILCHFRHSSALWSYRTHISVTPLLVSVPLVFLLVLVLGFLLPHFLPSVFVNTLYLVSLMSSMTAILFVIAEVF